MMRKRTAKRTLLGAICAATLALVAGAPVAQGAASDPLVVSVPTSPPDAMLSGPCGLAVDSEGRFYISDYYHHAIKKGSAIFNTVSKEWVVVGYSSAISNVEPLDGPCALALDSTNKLYVNNFHRNVTKYNASPSFGSGAVLPLPSEDTAHHLPTGVAVDPATDYVYVNHRTYVSVFDSAGNPVLDGLEPLKIGLGTLGDAYGVAVSQFPGTLGRIYVPDAASNTVKVYDTSASKVNPVAEIKDPFNKPFISLRDSAIAVDRVTGDVYFADNTQPKYTERPQATIHIYSSTGSYKGHLKYNVTDALPVGLAVDNSALTTQGFVYVTSGNTDKAGVYVYGPGAGTFASPLPPISSIAISTTGSGSGAITNSVNSLECTSSCQTEMLSGGELSLTATPDPGSEFAGWSGDACAGAEATCTLTLTEATTVSAHFLTESSSNQAPSPLISPAGPEAQKPRAAQAMKRCRKAKAKRCRARHHRIAKHR